jgi:predicted ester cyclase
MGGRCARPRTFREGGIMSVEENKKLVRELIERMANGDSSVIDELTTQGFVWHNLWGKGADHDRVALKRTNDGGHAAFSDYSVAVNDILAEGDKVMVLSTRSCKHTGEFWNVFPTGKNLNVFRFALYRLENAKIAELWVMDDQMGQFQQLGVIPPGMEFVRTYKESLNS